MKDERCFICKFKGLTKTETYSSEIYQPRGRSLTIPLCYDHSIDLFKMGQVNFIVKHKPNFTDYFGFENDELIMRYFEIKT
jgi:hypothetical protein